MLSSVDIKKAAIKLVNTENISDYDIGKVAMLLLDISLQLEYMEDQDQVSDSQLGLLKELQSDSKNRIEYLESKLTDALQLIDELYKQNKMLKEELYR